MILLFANALQEGAMNKIFVYMPKPHDVYSCGLLCPQKASLEPGLLDEYLRSAVRIVWLQCIPI
jgi:hypothetical protein